MQKLDQAVAANRWGMQRAMWANCGDERSNRAYYVVLFGSHAVRHMA